MSTAFRYAIVMALCALALRPAFAATSASSGGVRIKDLGRIEGVRDNQLIGYGIVGGLAGTGDSLRNRATRQSIANALSQFELNIPNEQIQSRNVATVMITASLAPLARSGDKFDVVVTSMGDARSLLGGTLLMTPLRGPDGRVYALAQGPISVGGYRYDLNGNVVQRNHPTVGLIPSGATIETAPVFTEDATRQGELLFLLAVPDNTTASRVAAAINAQFKSVGPIAEPRDARSVAIAAGPMSGAARVNFLTQIENLRITPDVAARVVVNERTGTVVSGGDVRISRVVVSHGDLRVSITTDFLVSQPTFVRDVGPDVRTQVVPRTRIDVAEPPAEVATILADSTVADLVQALNRVRTTPRDVISILQAIKAAGALHAELLIQ
jgi:flagellar P-ring protein precursor FlgI